MKQSRTMLGALVVGVTNSTAAFSAPPVPIYNSHIVSTERESPNSTVQRSNDSVDVVAAWFRSKISDKTNDISSNGRVIIYAKSGAVVLISPGIPRFDPATKIGYQWDAKKYGPFPRK